MVKQQRQVYFTGTVQGVGFRYTAYRLAGRYRVSGTVRNLPDGRVHCLVEGEDDQINAFLEDLTRAMSGYIHNQTQEIVPHSGKFDSFTIGF